MQRWSLFLLGLVAWQIRAGGETVPIEEEDKPIVAEAAPDKADRLVLYGKKGLEYDSDDGRTFLWLGLRLQARYDTLPGTLTAAEDLHASDPETSLNRGRIKGGGHLFAEWFEVYSEYDFTSDTLLDYRATVHVGETLGFRFGQWKVEYNRERIDSSGVQQLVDRSLSNYWFTLDRQLGVAASIRLWQKQPTDSMIWLEWLSGRGVGRAFQGDNGLAMMRWQWNPQGEVLDFSQGDLARREKPVSAIALAGVYGLSPYTQFSSDGGGQLPGFGAGSYRLFQATIDSAWHWRGFSWQQELHWKEITNRATSSVRHLAGGYAQGGAFVSSLWPGLPKPLEVTARFSLVDPDLDQPVPEQRDYTLGANWYFHGHRNKLSADFSWLNFTTAHATRFRLQWDVSL